MDRWPKYVGERVKMSLRTRDPKEAANRRDLVQEALEKTKAASGKKFSLLGR